MQTNLTIALFKNDVFGRKSIGVNITINDELKRFLPNTIQTERFVTVCLV